MRDHPHEKAHPQAQARRRQTLLIVVEFTEKLAALICERMAKGESLRSICRDENMPAESNVRFWAIQDKPAGFAAQYERSRLAQMDAWADEILDIADDTSNDTHTTTYENGIERTSPNTEWISRSRLKVDARKWLMSKIAPKRYGEHLKIDQETKHSVDDSVGALFERIGSQGKRIHDKS